ncbi:hypothetical protein BT63DRAFT_40792 [Microthyrium microscopicum]|uniref:Uncharacterized protein n=1 Tax=Microthyrium microscopicum TaxID=703497 RepID=A0A6A6UVQ9_9PEZI|nr:hypothetical protein BT63DRAFT_40792 [Microthyrium microscopicum]
MRACARHAGEGATMPVNPSCSFLHIGPGHWWNSPQTRSRSNIALPRAKVHFVLLILAICCVMMAQPEGSRSV